MEDETMKDVPKRFSYREMRRLQERCKELERKLKEKEEIIRKKDFGRRVERDTTGLRERLEESERKRTGVIKLAVPVFKALREKALGPTQREAEIIRMKYNNAKKKLAMMTHRYRLPSAPSVIRSVKLGVKVRHVLPHIRNRKKESSVQYQKMYDWGPRLGLTWENIMGRIKRLFKMDPDAEILISEKTNGVHVTACMRRPEDALDPLELVNIQGKNGEWRHGDKFKDLFHIFKMLDLHFAYDPSLFGTDSEHFLVGCEIILTEENAGASQNWWNVTQAVMKQKKIVSNFNSDEIKVSLIVYDVTKFELESARVTRYTPSEMDAIFQFWRRETQNVIAKYIYFSKTIWKQYCESLDKYNFKGPILHQVSMCEYQYRLSPEELSTTIMSSIHSQMLARILPRNVKLSQADTMVLRNIVSKGMFPSRREAYIVYQIWTMWMQNQQEQKITLNDTRILLQLTHAMETDATGFCIQLTAIRNPRFNYREPMQALHKMISDIRDSNGEGLVLYSHCNGKTKHSKSKRSYIRGPGNSAHCALFRQKYGFLVAYSGSKPFKACTTRPGKLEHVPDFILIYVVDSLLGDTDIGLHVLAAIPFKWFHLEDQVTEESEDQPAMFETLGCDSSGISAQAALFFYFLYMSKGSLENILPFSLNYKDDEMSSYYVEINSERIHLERPNSKLRYAMVQLEDHVVAVRCSQVILKGRRLELDGYFVEKIIPPKPVLPPPLLACTLAKRANLPIGVKLLLGQGTVIPPSLDHYITPEFLKEFLDRNTYESIKALKKHVNQRGERKPVQMVNVGSVLLLCRLISAKMKDVSQINEFNANGNAEQHFFWDQFVSNSMQISKAIRFESLSGLPNTGYKEITRYAKRTLLQLYLDMAFALAFEGMCHTDFMYIDSMTGQTTAHIQYDYISEWIRLNQEGLSIVMDFSRHRHRPRRSTREQFSLDSAFIEMSIVRPCAVGRMKIVRPFSKIKKRKTKAGRATAVPSEGAADVLHGFGVSIVASSERVPVELRGLSTKELCDMFVQKFDLSPEELGYRLNITSDVAGAMSLV